jgi:hypothetical protein
MVPAVGPTAALRGSKSSSRACEHCGQSLSLYRCATADSGALILAGGFVQAKGEAVLPGVAIDRASELRVRFSRHRCAPARLHVSRRSVANSKQLVPRACAC